MAKGECEGWTLATLYTHLSESIASVRDVIALNDKRYEQRFVDSKDAVFTALTAQEKAVSAARMTADKASDKAEEAQEKRNEGMNEFRGQLKDQAAGFVTRTELYLALAAVTSGLVATVAVLQFLKHP
jgi:hypothetical protein